MAHWLLSPGAFARCEAILSSSTKGKPLGSSVEGDDLFTHLVAGSFVVEEDFDELAFIEDQYNRERSRSQFLLTILPTFGCNLGCDYCFVGKKKGAMDRERQDQIIEFVTQRFATQKFPSMCRLVWWRTATGLAGDRILIVSLDLCARYDTPYSAQVITNGTMISDKAVEVMTNAGVDRLQITVDGLKEIHDVRRPSKLRVISSFEQTILGLGRVVGKFVIRPGSMSTSTIFLTHGGCWISLRSRGLGADVPFYPYWRVFRLSPMRVPPWPPRFVRSMSFRKRIRAG